MKKVCAIILAAGKGSRMKSELPKILHLIDGKPLILFPLETLKPLDLSQMITVVKHKADLVLPVIYPLSEIAYQGAQYGTAKAVEAALPIVDKNIDTIMVINGDDSMFYTKDTFKAVLKKHKKERNTITFITLLKDDPRGYGRVIYDKFGNFKKIVEEKDATEKQRNIKEVNDGVYIFDKTFLLATIEKVKPSKITGEYYLTDLINVALKNKKRVNTYLLKDDSEFFGISTKEDIKKAISFHTQLLYNN
jgi:bifunctional UDP-N-acetylglucosamine pyrophosphorylase/glucosamine-1-phosphate N-acetyltransferase